MLIKSEMLPGKAKTGTQAQLLQTGHTVWDLPPGWAYSGPHCPPVAHHTGCTGPRGETGISGSPETHSKGDKGTRMIGDCAHHTWPSRWQLCLRHRTCPHTPIVAYGSSAFPNPQLWFYSKVGCAMVPHGAICSSLQSQGNGGIASLGVVLGPRAAIWWYWFQGPQSQARLKVSPCKAGHWGRWLGIRGCSRQGLSREMSPEMLPSGLGLGHGGE